MPPAGERTPKLVSARERYGCGRRARSEAREGEKGSTHGSPPLSLTVHFFGPGGEAPSTYESGGRGEDGFARVR